MSRKELSRPIRAPSSPKANTPELEPSERAAPRRNHGTFAQTKFA